MGRTTKRTAQWIHENFEKELTKKGLEKQPASKGGYNLYNRFYSLIGAGVWIKSADCTVLRRNWQDAIIGYMEQDSGSIQAFFEKVVESARYLVHRDTLPLSTRDTFLGHKDKPFPTKSEGKDNDLEHAIQFNLLHKSLPPFGKFVAYEVYLEKQSSKSGRIDLIAYNAETNQLRLIELKRFALGELDENHEMFLRAYSEIITYRACFDSYDKDVLREQFNNIGLEIDFNKVEVINCIMAPQSMYEGVDERLRKFVNNASNPYRVELYAIAPTDGILQHKIGHDEILINVVPATLS